MWNNLLLGGGQLLSWRTVDCWILSTLGSVLCNCPASNPNWTRSKRKVNKSLYLLDNKALKGWWGCPSQLLTVQAVLLCWTHIINQSISQWASQVFGVLFYSLHILGTVMQRCVLTRFIFQATFCISTDSKTQKIKLLEFRHFVLSSNGFQY